MAGATFPLMGCITGIPTVDDDALEGDHEFSVSIDSVTPNDAVTFDPADTHVVTIIDNDGMLELLYTVRFLTVRYTIMEMDFLHAGMATFTLQAPPTPLDEGTATMCCVAISGLPADGLGCDIDVQLDVVDITTGTCK